MSPTNQNHCADPAGGGRIGFLPASPFYATRYHFGMLLGVDDFETEQAYHRGKMRLHNAWLHGEGVVWGFDVTVPDLLDQPDTPLGEIQVEPGLALDLAGRELHLDAKACLGVAAWFEAHQDDPALEVTEEDGRIRFDAHVVIRFRACLTRQVPAMSEPCSVGTGGTSYSRAQETVEILLLPGLSTPRRLPYHRLRLLFGLEDPGRDEDGIVLPADQEVLDERDRIGGLPAGDQPPAYLAAFRHFAALDEIDLHPFALPEGGSPLLFPADDDTQVVLADIRGITLEERDGGWVLRGAEVDRGVRPSHVATSTIQELLCGPLFTTTAAPPDGGDGSNGNGADGEDPDEEPAGEPDEPPPAEDAGGPRVDPSTINIEEDRITFDTVGPLSQNSVEPAAFAVTVFDRRNGWIHIDVVSASVNSQGDRVTIEIGPSPDGDMIRLIARGTGDSPLLGTNLVPLAGAVDGPPGSAHDGRDFVFMLRR